MFKKLAKSGFAKFWPAEPRRIAQGLHEVGLFDDTYANDNLPGFRRPAAAGKRRSPAPALTCHWLERNGRLECRRQAERSGDKTIGDLTSAVRRADPRSDRRLLHACHRTMPTNANLAYASCNCE